jgi:hypothetical protein
MESLFAFGNILIGDNRILSKALAKAKAEAEELEP